MPWFSGVIRKRTRSGLRTTGLAIIAVVVLTGCFGPPRERLDLTFINSSESDLCYHRSMADANGSDACPEVPASGKTVWRPSCGRNDTDPLPFTVVLTDKVDGHIVYNRTATCGEWRGARATFIIKQVDDELLVTDSLP